MKPFRFPLESLRTLRKHKEDMARRSYADALRACEVAKTLLEHANAELSAAWAGLRHQVTAGISGGELVRRCAWCQALERRSQERAGALEASRRGAALAWQGFMSATRERESLDRLHAKRLRAFNVGSQRYEQKGLDELAVQLGRAPLSQYTALNPAPATL